MAEKKYGEIMMKNVDMTEDLKKMVMGFTEEAFMNAQRPSDVAKYIRQKCDESPEGKFWNVVVGRNYGSDVTHMAKRYISMQFRDMYVLIW
eukprot:CAMPEP_0197515138 /NCGR_PEP_ID=MMETSP1318-20131121/356_1 /TAXON_ID=552666 /ORGANISM="Partenskyella glossopodia, Strain RCC365" /LENGTH=90 /DNA_ID=CAMNT_0043063421 /DNA_START=80 /DNA_END=349 /DNA_ORIENTATION=+